MLERLEIESFAVARSVSLEPGPGLNVFTGETGAGKSLIVDALAFVFGAKRGREVVAPGAERARVSARLLLPEGLIELERSVGLSGRSGVRIDGRPVSLEIAQALGARCLDLHGQSEQLALLRPDAQLQLIDRFAGCEPLVSAFGARARELREVRRLLGTAAAGARERERRISQLEFETEEIAAAALRPGEDHELRAEQARLGSTARRLEDLETALLALDSGSLGEAIRAVESIAARDDEADHLLDTARLLEAAAADLTRSLRRYRDAVEDDPARLAAVGERLDLIGRLRRKYGETVEEICAYRGAAAAELEGLTSTDASLESLERRAGQLETELSELGSELSQRRREAAGRLTRAVAAELERLGMAASALSVGFACEDDEAGIGVPLPDYEVINAGARAAELGSESFPRGFLESGFDRVTLLASFNEGATARPLAAVASGGEASRFLLALTTVFGASAERRLVVLDEVDEGVGGRAGSLVGEALLRLAARHQVLCITHLPQVAVFADAHFVVSKRVAGGSTWSEVHRLAETARIDELASMLGSPSDASRAAVAELLSAARGR